MTKNLNNLQTVYNILEKASDYLRLAEYSWDEYSLTEDQGNTVLEANDKIITILNVLDRDITQIKDQEDSIRNEEDTEIELDQEGDDSHDDYWEYWD